MITRITAILLLTISFYGNNLTAQILPCDAIEMATTNDCNSHSLSFTNSSASLTPGLLPNCGNYVEGGQWIQFSFPDQGQALLVDFNSSNPSFNPEVAIYNGDCNGLTMIDCFDASNFDADQNLVIDDGCGFVLTGQDIWLFVWNQGGSINADYDLCLTNHQLNVVEMDMDCDDLPNAGNICCDAPVFDLCDLDNFCSSTGDLMATDQPAAFCGDLENNQWIGFIAENASVQIEIEVGSCVLQNGLQAQIYQTNDCNFFVPVSPCYNNAIPTSIITESTGLTPGDVYYIMIDGWGADVCDYSLNVVNGLSSVDVPQTNDTICFGGQISLDVVTTGSGITGIEWTADPTLDVTDPFNPVATPTTNTVYYMQIEGFACDTLLEVPIFVRPQLENFDWTVDEAVCANDPVQIEFQFPDNEIYDVVYNDGTNNQTLIDIVDGHILDISIAANTTFEFLSVTNAQGCSLDLNLLEMVTIAPVWDTISVSYTCQTDGTVIADVEFTHDNLMVTSGDGIYDDFHFISAPFASNTATTLIMTDPYSCQTMTIDLTYICPCADGFEVNIDVVTALDCNNQDGAELGAIVEGGFGTLNYTWSTNQTGTSIDDLAAGTYMVTITDGLSCMTADTIILEDVEAISFDVLSLDPLCANESTGSIVFDNLMGGLLPLEYSIDGDTWFLDSVFNDLEAGDYMVMVKDQNNCIVEDEVALVEQVVFSVGISGNDNVELGTLVNLNVLVTNVIDTLIWSPNYYAHCTDCDNYIIEPTITDTYSVLAIDENGCQAESSISINVFNNQEIFVPTVFTPNFDGLNDYLSVFGGQSVLSVLKYEVFDRWGERVYYEEDLKVNDISAGWDGTYKNVKANQGVYVYSVIVEFKDGTTGNFFGDATLVR